VSLRSWPPHLARCTPGCAGLALAPPPPPPGCLWAADGCQATHAWSVRFPSGYWALRTLGRCARRLARAISCAERSGNLAVDAHERASWPENLDHFLKGPDHTARNAGRRYHRRYPAGRSPLRARPQASMADHRGARRRSTTRQGFCTRPNCGSGAAQLWSVCRSAAD
jgi:hypothetical protein